MALLARSAAAAAGPPIEVRALSPAPSHPDIAVLRHRDHRLGPAARALARFVAGTAG